MVKTIPTALLSNNTSALHRIPHIWKQLPGAVKSRCLRPIRLSETDISIPTIFPGALAAGRKEC